MWAITGAVAIAVPAMATSQVEDGLSACVDVEDTLRRLACYDELAASIGLAPPEVVPIPEAYAVREDDTPPTVDELPERGIWEATVENNDDGEPVAVRLLSWAISGASTEGYAISMTISCRRGRTSLSIRWEDYLGSWTSISARLDDERARTREWNLSTDGRSSFYSGRTFAFINDMIQADVATFEVTPYARAAVTAQFDTSGLGESFEPWRGLCRR